MARRGRAWGNALGGYRTQARDSKGRFASGTSRRKVSRKKATRKKVARRQAPRQKWGAKTQFSSGGITYQTHRRTTILASGTTVKGNMFIAPIPQKQLEVNAFQGKKLIGYADARYSRKRGIVVENIFVDSPYRGRGVSDGLLKGADVKFRGSKITASTYRTAQGQRLAQRMSSKGMADSAAYRASSSTSGANLAQDFKDRQEMLQGKRLF